MSHARQRLSLALACGARLATASTRSHDGNHTRHGPDRRRGGAGAQSPGRPDKDLADGHDGHPGSYIAPS